MFETSKTISGTWGSVKINGLIAAEAIGLEAKVTIIKEEVKQTGTYVKGFKVIGTEGKGTIKLNKVYSRFIQLMDGNMQEGKSTEVTIESLLEDPQSYGKEGVILKECIFDELPLVDWEAGKIGEESVPFTFGGWLITDTIDAPGMEEDDD